MKKFWKVLGFTALVAGLAPYKVEKDEETGENSYQSLLMRVTSAPGVEEGEKRRIGINLGEGTLTSKILDMAEKKEANEPHLFSDEISVEYAPAEEAEPVVEVAADEAEKEVEKIVEAAESVEPVEPAEPVEAVEPEEPAEPEEPKD